MTRIRQAAADGRIELAPTVLVDALESYVELVLNALGHSEALVTDLSRIGDLGLDDDERSAASVQLGLILSDDDYIYEIARRLRYQAQEQSTSRAMEIVRYFLAMCRYKAR
jgi:hypothetical protein